MTFYVLASLTYISRMITNHKYFVNLYGSISIFKPKKSVSYFKEKGVNHNVINNNGFLYSFIEIEIK